jgi:hypothetical protein
MGEVDHLGGSAHEIGSRFVALLFLLGLFFGYAVDARHRCFGLPQMAKNSCRCQAGLGVVEGRVCGLIGPPILSNFSGAAPQFEAALDTEVEDS